MFKHILGQAIYQFIILLVLIFDGDNFIPEYKDKFDETILKTPGTPWSVKYNEGGYVRSGRYIYVNDPEKSDYQHLEDVKNYLKYLKKQRNNTDLWTIQTFHHSVQYFRLDEHIQLPQCETNQR